MSVVSWSRRLIVSKMEIVRKEGGRAVTGQIEHYNLDAIISVDYLGLKP